MMLPRTFALGSLGISLVVVLIKGFAFHLTGSVALLSDALESVVNVATALASLAAIRFSAEPADKKHPYGHHKAECFAAVIVGALIVLAGLAILRESWFSLLAPKPIDAPLLGLGVSSIATVFNAVWSAVLIRQGRRSHSPVLVADGKHLLADVVTSVGVVVGVVLVVVTKIQALDAIVAGLVALHVLWSGWEVIRKTPAACSTRRLRKINSPRSSASSRITPRTFSKSMMFAHATRAERPSLIFISSYRAT